MDNSTCVFDGCDSSKVVARQLCGKHYQQASKAGRLHEYAKPPRARVPLMDRIRRIGWTVTSRGCWEWNGADNGYGYGAISSGDRSPSGHSLPKLVMRAMMEEQGHKLTSEDCVMHLCDNPPCVNPAHLRVGTKTDNNRDMARKRRTANGERRPQSRLTDAQVDEIRDLYATGKFSQRALGEMFGITDGYVSMLVRYVSRAEKTYPVPHYYGRTTGRAA